MPYLILIYAVGIFLLGHGKFRFLKPYFFPGLQIKTENSSVPNPSYEHLCQWIILLTEHNRMGQRSDRLLILDSQHVEGFSS